MQFSLCRFQVQWPLFLVEECAPFSGARGDTNNKFMSFPRYYSWYFSSGAQFFLAGNLTSIFVFRMVSDCSNLMITTFLSYSIAGCFSSHYSTAFGAVRINSLLFFHSLYSLLYLVHFTKYLTSGGFSFGRMSFLSTIFSISHWFSHSFDLHRVWFLNIPSPWISQPQAE